MVEAFQSQRGRHFAWKLKSAYYQTGCLGTDTFRSSDTLILTGTCAVLFGEINKNTGLVTL